MSIYQLRMMSTLPANSIRICDTSGHDSEISFCAVASFPISCLNILPGLLLLQLVYLQILFDNREPVCVLVLSP